MRIISKISIPEINLGNDKNCSIDKLHNEYKIQCESFEQKVGFIYMSIYSDKEKYEDLSELLLKNNIKYWEDKTIVYDKSEIENASYFIMWPIYECKSSYDKDPIEFFELFSDRYEIYIKQHSDLIIRKKELGKKDIIRTVSGEFIVTDKLKEIIEQENLTGVSFRSVYSIGEAKPVAYQIISNNILPPVHPLTKLKVEDEDLATNFTTYIIESASPTYYRNEIFSIGKDFNKSYEYFGFGIYPRQDIIITQRVRQLLISNKIKGIQFEPIFILDKL